jgi:hypothetical protein
MQNRNTGLSCCFVRWRHLQYPTRREPLSEPLEQKGEKTRRGGGGEREIIATTVKGQGIKITAAVVPRRVKVEARLNTVQEFGPYLKENTLHHYEDRMVTDVRSDRLLIIFSLINSLYLV